MDRRRYRRLLDGRRAVEVVLPDRRGDDWYGLDALILDPEERRTWAAAWYRGGSLLTLLAIPQPAQPTGSLGRRLRERRLRA